MRSSFTGTFLGLLNPFALLCGIVSVAMLTMHGATWQTLRSGQPIQDRAAKTARLFAIITLVTFALAGVWVATLPGFEITSVIDPNAAANPLTKTVEVVDSGRWMANYSHYPWMIIAPVLGFIGAIGVVLLATTRFQALSFISSGLSQAGIIMTAGFSLFPFILPSSTHPEVSLTVWDATSSELTLGIMTFVAAVFVPIILGYTIWCFYKMWGRVTTKDITENSHSLY